MTESSGRFEWDNEKNSINIKKHGIDFAEILSVFDDPYFYEIYDINHSAEEDRFVGIGIVNGLLVVVVSYTERSKIRLISARRATRLEKEVYYEKRKNIDS
ncbi:BrnT family toxin [Treponema sp. OMZ 792]|uniref:BrnT family toxin n=1 Tax=unclassified Treponema TaxID=2638727 RepID=UPI0020A5056B|nr:MULTISPECIES: BrnT family toxin [unclassified Treponema]UTC75924.1 BrnT family toxin [Treponema sp. OMZ 792]UTC79924.1 BrnT family toxin [Treponema sp. OMZ 798]